MKVKVSRVVHHPPEAVFGLVADAGRAPTWLGGDVQHVSGEGRGARHRSVHRVGPHEVITEAVITAWEPRGRIAWRTEHEALDHEAEMRFLPHRLGTRIVQTDRETWHHAPWWTRWLARPSVRRALQRRLAMIERELDHVHGGSGGTAPAGRRVADDASTHREG